MTSELDSQGGLGFHLNSIALPCSEFQEDSKPSFGSVLIGVGVSEVDEELW